MSGSTTGPSFSQKPAVPPFEMRMYNIPALPLPCLFRLVFELSLQMLANHWRHLRGLLLSDDPVHHRQR